MFEELVKNLLKIEDNTKLALSIMNKRNLDAEMSIAKDKIEKTNKLVSNTIKLLMMSLKNGIKMNI